MITDQVTESTQSGNSIGDDPPEQNDSGDDSTSDDIQLSRDEIFDLLRNRRRRDVLSYLDADPEGTATLDTLAEHIAARENEVPVDQLTSAQRKRVYIGLYQGHLPKMDKLGVIAYEQDRGTVELRDISQLTPYLYESEEKETASTGRIVPVLGVAVLVVIGLSGVGPAGAVPATALAVLSTTALLVVTLRDTVGDTPDWLPW